VDAPAAGVAGVAGAAAAVAGAAAAVQGAAAVCGVVRGGALECRGLVSSV
jgi:xanthine/CO dehydrogenase XdhC/CoxF family maturation factor